jgi:hypothetical protein
VFCSVKSDGHCSYLLLHSLSVFSVVCHINAGI